MGLGHSPRIVTDGMVLCLDAANPRNFDLTKVEVLVVAGGGGGGGEQETPAGGGGGAGGLIYSSIYTITPGSAITATVGDGGAGGIGRAVGSNGGNSVFGALTAIGGGGGGFYSGLPSSGGSGGGAGWRSVVTSGGIGTAGQGFDGGSVYEVGNPQGAAGGGGAGGAGGDSIVRNGGAGGVGLQFTISGTSTYYAGGGGGGGGYGDATPGTGAIGGSNVGGSGGNAAAGGTVGSPGVTNSGGGGGGAGADDASVYIQKSGGAGGSGIIIVRYPGPQKAIGGVVTSVGGDTIHTFTTSGNFTPLVATNGSAVLGLSDLSGNRNFGKSEGGVIYSSANGGSLSFEGSDEYVTFSSTSLNLYPITLSFWATPSGEVINKYVASSGNGYRVSFETGGISGYYFKSGSDYTLNYDAYYGSGTLGVFSYGTMTVDATGVKFYINGQLVGSNSWTGTAGPPTTAEVFKLGVYSSSYRTGNIAQVSVYNRALTAAEITQNFNALRGRYGL